MKRNTDGMANGYVIRTVKEYVGKGGQSESNAMDMEERKAEEEVIVQCTATPH